MYVLKVLFYDKQKSAAAVDASIPIPSIEFLQSNWAQKVLSALDTKGIMVAALRDSMKTTLANVDKNLSSGGGEAVLVDIDETNIRIYIVLKASESQPGQTLPAPAKDV